MKSLLPPNSTPFERALEEALYSSTALDVGFNELYNYQTCAKEHLSYLAWTLGVEIWGDDSRMSEQQKRELIKEYIGIRTLRGTKAAIEKAYGILGVKVTIEENPRRKNEDGSLGDPLPYKFRLKIKGQSISERFRSEIMRMTDLLKPLRTEYFFDISYEFDGPKIKLAPMQRVTGIVRIKGELL
ncbi:MAG: phage tail protein I [Oligoflexales bacterium]